MHHQHCSTHPIPALPQGASAPLVGLVPGLLYIPVPVGGGTWGRTLRLGQELPPVQVTGDRGHKQFARNPAIETLQMATFAVFEQSMTDHFKCPVNTAHAIWDLHHHRQGAAESASEFLTAL